MKIWLASLALAGVLLLAMGALAHDADSGWAYPFECCSSQDCWEAGKATSEPNPVPSPAGWRLADGTVVAFAHARPSPDGRFHVCRRAGRPDGALIRPEGRPACLWVPAGG